MAGSNVGSRLQVLSLTARAKSFSSQKQAIVKKARAKGFPGHAKLAQLTAEVNQTWKLAL